MTTPCGPACDHCRTLLPNGCGYTFFFRSDLRFCSIECAGAAQEDRLRKGRCRELHIRRYRRRFWAVYDGNGDLVCVTVYKRGAREVVRRLTSA
jgi:hypothetical protein